MHGSHSPAVLESSPLLSGAKLSAALPRHVPLVVLEVRAHTGLLSVSSVSKVQSRIHDSLSTDWSVCSSGAMSVACVGTRSAATQRSRIYKRIGRVAAPLKV